MAVAAPSGVVPASDDTAAGTTSATGAAAAARGTEAGSPCRPITTSAAAATTPATHVMGNWRDLTGWPSAWRLRGERLRAAGRRSSHSPAFFRRLAWLRNRLFGSTSNQLTMPAVWLTSSRWFMP